MRIIAGEFRGRTLKAPKGEGTRPTTDRVREAMMSTVHSARGGFDDAVVLDAFAGSGALGLEALSRGARSVQFCERGGEALRALNANVRLLGLDARRARVRKGCLLYTSFPGRDGPRAARRRRLRWSGPRAGAADDTAPRTARRGPAAPAAARENGPEGFARTPWTE